MSQDQFLHLQSKTDWRLEAQPIARNGDGKYRTGVVLLTCRYGFWTQSSITIQFPPFLKHLNSNLLSRCKCLDYRVPPYVDAGPVRQPSLPSEVHCSSSRVSKMKPSHSDSEMCHVIKAYFPLTFIDKLVQPVKWRLGIQDSIVGRNRDISKDYCILGCDVIQRCRYTAMFRWQIILPSSGKINK
jgi:hypothetical protein